jgi:hypothetical protein
VRVPIHHRLSLSFSLCSLSWHALRCTHPSDWASYLSLPVKSAESLETATAAAKHLKQMSINRLEQMGQVDLSTANQNFLVDFANAIARLVFVHLHDAVELGPHFGAAAYIELGELLLATLNNTRAAQKEFDERLTSYFVTRIEVALKARCASNATPTDEGLRVIAEKAEMATTPPGEAIRWSSRVDNQAMEKAMEEEAMKEEAME